MELTATTGDADAENEVVDVAATDSDSDSDSDAEEVVVNATGSDAEEEVVVKATGADAEEEVVVKATGADAEVVVNATDASANAEGVVKATEADADAAVRAEATRQQQKQELQVNDVPADNPTEQNNNRLTNKSLRGAVFGQHKRRPSWTRKKKHKPSSAVPPVCSAVDSDQAEHGPWHLTQTTGADALAWALAVAAMLPEAKAAAVATFPEEQRSVALAAFEKAAELAAASPEETVKLMAALDSLDRVADTTTSHDQSRNIDEGSEGGLGNPQPDSTTLVVDASEGEPLTALMRRKRPHKRIGSYELMSSHSLVPGTCTTACVTLLNWYPPYTLLDSWYVRK